MQILLVQYHHNVLRFSQYAPTVKIHRPLRSLRYPSRVHHTPAWRVTSPGSRTVGLNVNKRITSKGIQYQHNCIGVHRQLKLRIERSVHYDSRAFVVLCEDA